MTDRETLAALLHDPEGICDDDQVGDPRTCERLADRLIAAGVRLGDERLRAINLDQHAAELHTRRAGTAAQPSHSDWVVAFSAANRASRGSTVKQAWPYCPECVRLGDEGLRAAALGVYHGRIGFENPRDPDILALGVALFPDRAARAEGDSR